MKMATIIIHFFRFETVVPVYQTMHPDFGLLENIYYR